ncbi:class II glutamine amidotransferase [Vibrio tapetis subsp. quintayensis]|uniref:class II glutamine amidotransferase n=1 Tax=Vibrio tapetis TaxID=52443 RepID=UPI0025B4D0EC|nr:class II glutamine amidotransferase [Vibrio tapetis]MDN3680231.1 class II glutamine amidotransferase [Vibrio tapetis subsp. quintayensis]
MCRWLAYQGSPIYLDELVYQPEHSLIQQSLDARKAVTRVNADGFGLGWYTEQTSPGQFHEVLPAWGDENLRSLAHHIRSHRFMAHVRSSTGAQVSRANCHPFVLDNWMFLHNGQIGEFELVKFDLERSLPEALYLKRLGTTDSELIFLLMLKNDLKQDPVNAIRTTLAEIEHACRSKGVSDPFKASICLSDGNQLWVVRYSTDKQPPTVFVRRNGENVTLASEPLDKTQGWKSLEKQAISLFQSDQITHFSL